MINIVVTCTRRKRFTPHTDLCLRNVHRSGIAGAFEDWMSRLNSADSDSVAVESLYTGDHWAVVQSLPETSCNMGRDIRIWVCSAGYGLISLKALVKPYSATFSRRHPDSVSAFEGLDSSGDASRHWWRLLSSYPGPERSGHRSISALAGTCPDAPIIVAASRTYVNALSDDLREAVGNLESPSLLSIVSAGTKRLPGLDDHLLPVDARLKNAVGGVLRSLNIRVLRHALAESSLECLTYPELRSWIDRLLAKQPAIIRHQRQTLTDQEVCEYIFRQLQESPGAAHSKLLRKYRDAGFACEQSRFASLYRAVKESE